MAAREVAEHDPPGQRRDPGSSTEAPQDRWAATDEIVARCRVCGHVITSPDSIAAGIGYDCRRKLRRALRMADVETWGAYADLLEHDDYERGIPVDGHNFGEVAG